MITKSHRLGSKVFTDAVLELYNLDPTIIILKSANIYAGIEPVSNNPSQANQTMLFDGDTNGFYKFDPLKTEILSSSTRGLVKATSS